MNILPFVAIFLVLLAIFSSSFFENGKIFLLEKKASIGFLAAERELEQKIHLEAWKKAPKKKAEKKEGEELTKPLKDEDIAILEEIEVTEFSRENLTNQKVNLFVFFNQDLDPRALLVFENFFKSFYEHAPFMKDSGKDLSEFLKNYRKAGIDLLERLRKENKESETLTLLDFYPASEDEKALYYPMLRGTNQPGYPALEDVFCYRPQQNTKIFSFPSLSSSMLISIFGKDAAASIQEEERLLQQNDPKGLFKPLTQDQLKEVLHKKHPSQDFDAIIELLDFSRVKITDPFIIAEDAATSILRKKEKKQL